MTTLEHEKLLFQDFQEHFDTPIEFGDFHFLYHFLNGWPLHCDENGLPLDARSAMGQRQLRIIRLYKVNSFYQVMECFKQQYDKIYQLSNPDNKDEPH